MLTKAIGDIRMSQIDTFMKVILMHYQYNNRTSNIFQTDVDFCLYLQGSESEVRRHEQTANHEHFDILVKHVEEVDLKRIQSNTQLEVRTYNMD